MKYTNRLDLPQYLVDWLVADDYDHSVESQTLSATTLMKPIKIHWLTARHGKDLVMDVSDVLASRYGSAIHDSIEKVNTVNVTKEQRASKLITVNGREYKVTGKYDVLTFENGIWTLRDVKTTSVWAYIYGGKDLDYQRQLSIYRWLLHEKQPVSDVAYIDFFFTDWQSIKAKQDESYPNYRLHPGYKIDLLSVEATHQYIMERVSEFDKYKDADDNLLPACTKEELWATEDKYAVYKPDGKKATKLCNSNVEAELYLKDKLFNKGFIDFRPGKVKRCKYCSAAPFCSQFELLQQQGLIDNY